jgi:predicted nucleic acid-binding protein
VIVADASAILEMLLRTAAGEAVEGRLLRRGETIHAPALVDLEVVQVLRRYVARREMTPVRAQTTIDMMIGFPMERYTHEPLLPRIWELRDNLTAYDAAYVALAEGLHAPLLTCDAHLANAPGIRAVVELIG